MKMPVSLMYLLPRCQKLSKAAFFSITDLNKFIGLGVSISTLFSDI